MVNDRKSENQPGRKRRSVASAVVRALLPMNILELLAQQPRHGLAMQQAVKHESGGTWVPSAGTLYPLLQRLEDEGLIASELQSGHAAPRRVYWLTEAGKVERQARRGVLVVELTHAKQLIEQHIAVFSGEGKLTPHGAAEMVAILTEHE